MTAYLNGVRRKRIERFTPPPAERLDTIRLGGALRPKNRGFIGSLDELKIFDYARSPRQIALSAEIDPAPSAE